MKFEIESAANFLSNLLKLHSNVLSPEQLERFREAIESCLEGHYENHWFPDRPTKGSGYRCIRINHKMDPLLSKAGKSCGIDNQALRTVFPNELTLWIDPREVSYRIGENGSICVLFDGNSTSGGSSDSDSGSTSSGSSISSSPPNGSLNESSKSTILSQPNNNLSSSFQMMSMATSPPSNNHHNHHIGGGHHNSFSMGNTQVTGGNRKQQLQQLMTISGDQQHSSPLHPNQYPVNNVMRRSPSHNRTTSNGFSHYNGHQHLSSHHQVQQHSMNGHHSQSMRAGAGHGPLNNGQQQSSHAGRGSPTDSSSTSTMSSPSPSSSPDWCKMGLVYDRRSSPEHWQRSPMSGPGQQHNMNNHGDGHSQQQQQQHTQSMSSRQHSSPLSVMGHGSHGMDSHTQHSVGMFGPYGPQGMANPNGHHQQQLQHSQQHQGNGSGFSFNPGVINGHHQQQRQQQQYSSFGTNRNFTAGGPSVAGVYAAANTWAGSPF